MRLHRMIVMVACLVLIHASTSFADDEIAGWGKSVDPDGDCQFTLADQALVIVAPGPRHGLSIEVGRMNAPRVLRKANFDA